MEPQTMDAGSHFIQWAESIMTSKFALGAFLMVCFFTMSLIVLVISKRDRRLLDNYMADVNTRLRHCESKHTLCELRTKGLLHIAFRFLAVAKQRSGGRRSGEMDTELKEAEAMMNDLLGDELREAEAAVDAAWDGHERRHSEDRREE